MKAITRSISIAVLLSAIFSVQAAPAVADKHHRTRQSVAVQEAGPVDINTADSATLARLKGIGLKKAKLIVTYRQKQGNFKSLQDLASVPGIGKKAVDRLIKNNPNRLTINP